MNGIKNIEVSDATITIEEMQEMLQQARDSKGSIEKLLKVVPTCIVDADGDIFSLNIVLCRGGLQIVEYSDGCGKRLAHSEHPKLAEAMVYAVEQLCKAWEPGWEDVF